MVRLLSLLCLIVLAQPVWAQDSPGAALAESCFQCHGDGGVSALATRPTLAGQKARYLKRQLELFRLAHEQGRLLVPGMPARGDMLMSHISAKLNDSTIDALSAYMETLACDGGVKKDVGEVVVPAGAAQCAECHGENGFTDDPDVPNIAGQTQGYIKRQLVLFRESALSIADDGGPTWRTHPLMKKNAVALSLEQIDALSVYYSALS